MSLAPDPIHATSTESSGPAEALRRLRHDASVARGLACFGAGMTIGVVFGVADTVALDAGREIDAWYQIAAAALAVGAVLSILVARAAVNLGAGIGRVLAATSLVSGGVWLALYNTGEPAAVDVLVAVGLGAAVPMVLLAGLDAVSLHPSVRRIAAFGQPAAATLAGVGIGAFVMFVDPTLVWSDITTVGGAIALVGALRRLRLPSKVASAAPASARPTSVDRSPAGVRVFLAVTVGIAAAGLVRVGPYLHDGWQAGVRYQLLTWALAGAVGTAIVVGAIWVPARRARDAATEVDDAARLTALAGATMLIVAASQTLPGTVIGTGAAAGAAAATLVMLGAAGARGERGAGAAAVAVGVAGAAAWTATWVAWPTLLDALDSDRVVLAVIGLPAAVAGVMVWLRPVGAAATEPADRVAAASAWTAPVGSVGSASTATFDVSASMLPPPVIDLTVPVVTPPPFSNGSASRTTSKVLLDARGVEFSYGAVQVLFGVDLQVRQGEVVALLGTNGAGKTTFLRTVAGLASPSAGSIRLAGGDLARFSASDRVLLGVNQIAADAAVAPDLTVAENLAMFGHTLPRGEARAGADRAVAIFPRLGERLGQRASALSGGERQMLSLSKSIVLRPRLLIIDECTLGLAPIAVAMLVPVIRRLHEEGSSVLLVEQSVHLALDLASRACCMEKGRIVYESDADELRADPGLLEAVYLEGITAALEQRHGVHGQGPVAP